MVLVLEQDLECVVPVLVFDESGENGRLALLTVMGRDILPVSARKELVLENGPATFSQARSRISSSRPPLRKTLRTPQLQQKSTKSRNMYTAERTLVSQAGFQGRQCANFITTCLRHIALVAVAFRAEELSSKQGYVALTVILLNEIEIFSSIDEMFPGDSSGETFGSTDLVNIPTCRTLHCDWGQMNNWEGSKQLLPLPFIYFTDALSKLGRSTRNSAVTLPKPKATSSEGICLARGTLRGRCQGTLPLLVLLLFMSWSAAAMAHE